MRTSTTKRETKMLESLMRLPETNFKSDVLRFNQEISRMISR